MLIPANQMIEVQPMPQISIYAISGYSTILGCVVQLIYHNEFITAITFGGNTKPNKYITAMAGQYIQFNLAMPDTGMKLRDSLIPLNLYDSEAGQVLYGEN